MNTTTPRAITLLLLSVFVHVGCAEPARRTPRGPVCEAPRRAAVSLPAPTPRDGCEVLEHTGHCALERVETVEPGSDGEREVVAVYRVDDPAVTLRAERRFRVAWLAHGEASHIAHVRSHPVVACRWQTVVQGACPAHPPTVQVPEDETRVRETRQARARLRTRRRAT